MAEFIPIYLPQSGPNDVTATLVEWAKVAGHWVNASETVAVAETTKSVFDIEAPQAGYAEQCFFHDVRPDAAGFCRAGVINAGLDGGDGLAAYVRWRKAELPLLVQWKQMGAGDYVVGLEPGNLPPEGRRRAHEAGRLRLLAPGEVAHLALEFGAARGKEAIGRLL